MKEKIIARLKALFSGLNLSNSRIDAIADKLASKITDENLIDARLNELNEISPFSEIAKYDDWQRSKEAKDKADKEKADKDKADKEKADRDKADKDKSNSDKDTPEWAKGLITQNQELLTRLNTLEAGKAAETHNSKLLAILKEKTVPETYYGPAVLGRNFKDEAEVTTFANTLVEAYGKFSQEKINTDLGKQPGPIIGVVGDPKTEVSSDMQALIKEKRATAEKQNAAVKA